MKFPNIDSAQAYSSTHEQMIYVEIEGAEGVLQVYPGGRKVFVAADKGKIYERWRKRLTPDEEFKTPYCNGERCIRCGASFNEFPYARQINGICMECHREGGLLDQLREEADL
jgi:hypothetical protein